MSYQDRMVRSTSRAVETLFKNARAVPADKLEWQPMDQGRTVLDQLQECSSSPRFYAMILEEKKFPEISDEDRATMQAERKSWATIDDCEKACKAYTDRFIAAVKNISDNELDTVIEIPGRDQEFTISDIVAAHCNHLLYHNGQINYMQTLYGDFDMH